MQLSERRGITAHVAYPPNDVVHHIVGGHTEKANLSRGVDAPLPIASRSTRFTVAPLEVSFQRLN